MPRLSYTVQVAPELCQQYEEWRPITDLADEIKIVTHEDGTAEMYFRVKPRVYPVSTNGDQAHQ